MSSDLVAGPDLGGGYLHQLSIDRTDDRTTFTYHAQDGGADAGGPPIGALDAFGYAHPPTACQFGGPRCWHRRFLLPFAELPRVRQTYNRSRFVMEAMLRQRYAGGPVPVEGALREVVGRVAPAFAREGIPWYVGGSTAARLLGAAVEPHDLDLGTDRAGVDRLGALLAEYLIEPVAPTDRPGGGIVHGGRAFVGTLQQGMRVEWAVPLDPVPAAGGADAEWASVGAVHLLSVTFEGTELRVSRPEYALVRAAGRGATDRQDALAALVRRIGPEPGLLDQLLARSGLAADRADALRRAVQGPVGAGAKLS